MMSNLTDCVTIHYAQSLRPRFGLSYPPCMHVVFGSPNHGFRFSIQFQAKYHNLIEGLVSVIVTSWPLWCCAAILMMHWEHLVCLLHLRWLANVLLSWLVERLEFYAVEIIWDIMRESLNTAKSGHQHQLQAWSLHMFLLMKLGRWASSSWLSVNTILIWGKNVVTTAYTVQGLTTWVKMYSAFFHHFEGLNFLSFTQSN